MRRFLLSLLAALVPLAARADDPAAGVARFLDEQTLAVTRVDVARFRARPLADLLDEARVPKNALVREVIRSLDVARDALHNAGVAEVFVVASMADATAGLPFLVAPVKADSAPAVRKAVADLKAFGESDVIGSAVVAGPKATLRRLRDARPAERPEVSQALAAVEPKAVRLAVVPPADLRRVFEETIPTLPREMGGGPTAGITRGLRWLALGLDTAPAFRVKLVIRAADHKAAGELRDLWNAGIRLLGTVPATDSGEPLAKQFPKDFDGAAKFLTAEVDGEGDTAGFDREGLPLTPAALGKLFGTAADSSGRQRAANQLKQIGLALHNYHEAHGYFPPRAICDRNGRPLLSWRVAILPYLEAGDLHRDFRLDEPWDSEHNRKLIARMPEVFRCPLAGASLPGRTTYLAVTGPNAAFAPRPKMTAKGAVGHEIREFTDGLSNTLLVVDASDDLEVVWSRPDDWEVDPDAPTHGLVGHLPDRILSLYADGAVQMVPAGYKGWKAILTRDGGEAVTPP